jgi:dienelactone hydrolase
MLCGLSPGLEPDRQFARRLAESGCEVIVPTLIDRSDEWSGNSRLKRFTNQPHREWIYRQSYELGRHIIGYEVQKILALVDWFQQRPELPVGVAGYAEGGLLAFYAAALDQRISAALVSGYFQSRQQLWQEPIYRNVFGLLREFGDAEVASLIAPRALLIEYAELPAVTGPPKSREGRNGAAPGKLTTPEQWEVESELKRLQKFFPAQATVRPNARLFNGSEGRALQPIAPLPLIEFMAALGMGREALRPLGPAPESPQTVDAPSRQKRQLKELEDHTQRQLRMSESVRAGFFWTPLKKKAATRDSLRSNLWTEVIGRFDAATEPLQARTRSLTTNAAWTSYDVVLDVWPEVFAWGVLLVPANIKTGEQRPVVVCQHGLEGVPNDTITDDPKSSGFRYYKAYAARLAEQGYVVFAPHNPYRGQDRFRVLQRKANPLGKSLFSVITAQHDRILDWLETLPFVDRNRIGFYGLSYGGKTAMRVPALLPRYQLSICSADFNEWIVKNVTVDSPYSYLFTGEYEMPEFNLGNTFNYAEMAALIAPRPFMVERGHADGVAPDEWVAYEFAKVRRHFVEEGIGERAAIEFFDGPHSINGVGTFSFLERFLKEKR